MCVTESMCLYVCARVGSSACSSCCGAEISHLSRWERCRAPLGAWAAPTTSPFKEGVQMLHIFLKAEAPLCTELVQNFVWSREAFVRLSQIAMIALSPKLCSQKAKHGYNDYLKLLFLPNSNIFQRYSASDASLSPEILFHQDVLT